MKYLVMESFDSYAVLLDEEGRFVKSANFGYEIGQTIINPLLMRDKPLEKRKLSNRLITGILTVAAVFALFIGFNFYQNNYVSHSSIFMAINPEVEMVLNKKGEVIDLKGTNDDGRDLIDNYKIKSKDKVLVANELIERAIAQGFLTDGGKVSFAIDTLDLELFEKYGIELRQGIDGKISLIIEITDIEAKNKKTEESKELDELKDKELKDQPEKTPEKKPKSTDDDDDDDDD